MWEGRCESDFAGILSLHSLDLKSHIKTHWVILLDNTPSRFDFAKRCAYPNSLASTLCMPGDIRVAGKRDIFFATY